MDAGERIKIKFIDFEEFLLLSEDETFYERELVPFLYKMRLHPNEKEVFRELLFQDKRTPWAYAHG